MHQPIAFVAQDGQERLPVPWGRFQALFVGGSTRWKLGPHAAALVREAKWGGKWVHVGRVNTLRRIAWCKAVGVDSIDGSGFARFTRVRLPMGMAALAAPPRRRCCEPPTAGRVGVAAAIGGRGRGRRGQRQLSALVTWHPPMAAARDGGFDRTRYRAVRIDNAVAKRVVEREHYLQLFPRRA